MPIVISGTNGISGVDGTASNPSYEGTDANTGIFFPAADTVAIGTNGTEALRVNSSQNVGVGTTSPSVSGIEVSRATGVSPTPVELRLTTTTNDSGWSTSNPWGRLSFYSADASTGGAKIHASIQTVAQSSSGGNSNLEFFVTDTANGNLYRTLSFQGAGTNTTQTVFYSGGGTQAMTLDASGNFLVGATSRFSGFAADNKLYVESSTGDYICHFRSTQGTPYGPAISFSTAPNNTTSLFIDARDSSAQRFALRSNGGIANFSANNVNLSDERLKTDIQPAGSYLSKICAIPVKTFLYKDQNDSEPNLGVIAQDVEAVAPELVDASGFGETPEDGVPYKMIYQTDLQYALMKCIQEQQQMIETLQAKVAALEAK